jgi:hypothetical protein
MLTTREKFGIAALLALGIAAHGEIADAGSTVIGAIGLQRIFSGSTELKGAEEISCSSGMTCTLSGKRVTMSAAGGSGDGTCDANFCGHADASPGYNALLLLDSGLRPEADAGPAGYASQPLLDSGLRGEADAAPAGYAAQLLLDSGLRGEADSGYYDPAGAAAGCVDGGCNVADPTRDGIMSKSQASTVANVTAPNVGGMCAIKNPIADAGPCTSEPTGYIRGGDAGSCHTDYVTAANASVTTCDVVTSPANDIPLGSSATLQGTAPVTIDGDNSTHTMASNGGVHTAAMVAASGSVAGYESAANYTKTTAMFDVINKLYDQTTNGTAKTLDGGQYTTALGASDHFELECGVKRQDVDSGSPFCTGHYGREGECTNVDGGVICQSGNFPATDPETACAASDNVSLLGAAGGWSVQITGSGGQTNNWECIVKVFTMP